ncbi:hypothetical protein OIY81_8 [Cryptosporidium canis]|uniref:eRF1/Pelota-like N-terminal domain-containing protein n=1 Tax=Cryptosporidium canis TaxID=195482 RepID=A0ABQ8P9A5_9CRYT|nr:hypothetical protein OJ252_963 [Cryptosporidium canis]KAJ1615029.1 hypothetical protein OIY81_8 [Cryptosporidium canis]
MKLLKAKNSGSGFGYVRLKVETEDDIWDLYNLILSGDSVRSVTYRKTHKENSSGSVSVRVHKLVLTIIVKSTDYSSQSLRVSGFNAIDNEYIKMAVVGLAGPVAFGGVVQQEDWDGGRHPGLAGGERSRKHVSGNVPEDRQAVWGDSQYHKGPKQQPPVPREQEQVLSDDHPEPSFSFKSG